jgi:hypothetical protein
MWSHARGREPTSAGSPAKELVPSKLVFVDDAMGPCKIAPNRSVETADWERTEAPKCPSLCMGWGVPRLTEFDTAVAPCSLGLT